MNRINFLFTQVHITFARPGHLIANVKICRKHLNYQNRVHPSFLSFLLDNVTALNEKTLNSTLMMGVSMDIQIHFHNLKSGKLDDTLEVEANILDAQENMVFHKCTIRNLFDNVVIATGTHNTFRGGVYKSNKFLVQ